MPQTILYDKTGAAVGNVELGDVLFAAPVSVALLHQVVTAQLAGRRTGTADTRTRGEIRGGGKKPYRQKGTGRARQGSTRAPQFTGGGTVHGPTPRDYSQRTPKKMKAAALRGALSDRARHERIHVFSALVEGTAPSTKGAKAALAGVVTPDREHRHVLAVVARDDEAARRSIANLPAVHLLTPDQLNTYDVLRADDVVFTTAALEAFVTARTSGEADQ
jgi:large subunit ribosomal protein L4